MTDEKWCRGCLAWKDLDEFYPARGMADGYMSKCKDCKKRYASENRAAKHTQYAAYDRERNKTLERVEARRQYAATPYGKAVMRAANQRYRQKNRQPENSPAE